MKTSFQFLRPLFLFAIAFVNVAKSANAATITASPAFMNADSLVKKQLNIPAQKLDKAIRDFIRQSGMPVKYDALTKNFQSNAISGKFDPAVAVTKMVIGSGLEVHLEKNTFYINKQDQLEINRQAEILQARINQARVGRKLPQAGAEAMYKNLGKIMATAGELAKIQGFISAAQKNTFQQTFKDYEAKLK